MALTPTKFNSFVDNLAKAAINLNTAVYKIMLTNTQPLITNTTYASISANEIGHTTNGYTAGGATVPSTGASNAAGIESIAGSAVTWTAGPNDIGPFEWAVLYDSTSGVLIEWWDYGSAITLSGTNGDTLTLTPSGNVTFTIT